MIYAINLDQTCDPAAARNALAALVGVDRAANPEADPTEAPNERTPRYIHLSGPAGLGPQIEAVTGVCGCCDADAPNTPTVVTPMPPGRWNIAAVSGLSDDVYARDTPGPVLLLDSEPGGPAPTTKALVLDGPGNHGTGTRDIIWQVNPDCEVVAFAVFTANDTGSIALANAGFAAAADWLEDNQDLVPRGAPVSCSFQTSGPTSDPYAANIARIVAAGGILVCSSGNGGEDLRVVDRWPASNLSAIRAGSMNQARQRSNFSSGPADLYAGGEACTFLTLAGEVLANGTSISCPIVSASIRRALDEGRSLADVLANWPTEQVTNLLPGDTSGAILRVPTTETVIVPPPPPPPPPGGGPIQVGTAMQLIHKGAAQPLTASTDFSNPTIVSWDGVPEIPVPVGAGPKRFRAMVPISLAATNKQYILRIVRVADGKIMISKLEDKDGIGTRTPDVESRSYPAAEVEGHSFRVEVAHNAGANAFCNNLNGGGSALDDDMGYFEAVDA